MGHADPGHGGFCWNAAAQACTGSGVPLSAGISADPYTATVSAGVETEGTTGTQTCTLSIVAGQGQQYLWLRYTEFWFDTAAGATTFLCNATGPSGEDCANTITLTITGPGNVADTVTLSGDGTTMPPADSGPMWVIVANSSVSGFTGQLWGRTWARMIDVSSQTLRADATYQFQVTEVVPASTFVESISGTFTVGRSVTLVDPVTSLISPSSNQLVADPEPLATFGTPVVGVAADSASQVVIRIQAQFPGQTVTLNLMNDQGQISSNPGQDGLLSTVPAPSGSGPGGPPIPTFRRPHPERPGEPLPRTSAGSQPLQLTAVATNEGPMAFALYLPPANFSRGGNDDTAASREVSLSWTLGSGPVISLPPITEGCSVKLFRPPVVLVHGLWGDPSDWLSFLPSLNSFALNLVTSLANYNTSVFITSAMPPIYSPDTLGDATASSLGFAFNAPAVLSAIQSEIVKFRKQPQSRCATQADVIAHSMGGDITRYVAAKLPAWAGTESFAAGNVHELITIGTPHQGSPLATHLLSDSFCTAIQLAALGGKIALLSATVAGVSWDGGVGDLQPGSSGLSAINPSGGPLVPTALIAGAMSSNANGLSTSMGASTIRGLCSSTPDFLASNLTPSAWPSVFAAGNPANSVPGNSDAVVPVTSQCTPTLIIGSTCFNIVPGLVHSSGIEKLGFSPPGELDGNSGVVPLIIQLLNKPITGTGTPFVMVP